MERKRPRRFPLIKSGLKLILPDSFLKIVCLWRRKVMCQYVNFKYRNYSEGELAKFYKKDYHKKYINDSEEIKLKKWQTIAIKKAIPYLKKVLVAGCSGGELVKSLRNAGIKAYGFDISPDLDEIVLDQVRPYIKKGSMLKIPFSADDKFDGFIAIDVFEHVPMGKIDQMVREIFRINALYLVTVINYSEFDHLGHVTMKPLSWWQRKFNFFYKIDR